MGNPGGMDHVVCDVFVTGGMHGVMCCLLLGVMHHVLCCVMHHVVRRGV